MQGSGRVAIILAPGRRTVAVALRVIGLELTANFTNYHRVLNRNRWSGCRVARCLFRTLINTFVPTGSMIIYLDETIERRWGSKIKARGIYRPRFAWPAISSSEMEKGTLDT